MGYAHPHLERCGFRYPYTPRVMKLINLTPHPINLVGVGEINPSGTVARLEETTESTGGIYIDNVYIPTIRKKLGSIITLCGVKG